MRSKWTEKDVLEYARELKSPFEGISKNGQKPVAMPNMAEEIQRIVSKNKGVKPQ